MQQPTPAGGGSRRTPPLIPDLATLTRRMHDAGIPLLGISLTPSFRTLPRPGTVHKPTIGLVKRTDVEALLNQVGLPIDGYLPEVRSEPNAFKLAISAIKADQDFKRSGYFIREDEKAPKNHIQYVVVEEQSRDQNKIDIKYGTAQYIYYDRDTRKVYYDKRDGHRIVSPGGIIQPNLVDWWHKFLEYLDTEDVSHMIAKYLRYHCDAVPMRKGGGQYFVPKTQNAWPLNDKLAAIQEFCAKLKGLGDIGVLWTDLPIPDAESIRGNMAHHVTQEIGQKASQTVAKWKKLVQEMQQKGSKLQAGTGEAKIEELQALENRAELYIQLGLTQVEQLRDAVKTMRLEMKKELDAAAKSADGQSLTDILAGFANDVLGDGAPTKAAKAKIDPAAFTTVKQSGNGKHAPAEPAEEELSLTDLLAQFGEPATV